MTEIDRIKAEIEFLQQDLEEAKRKEKEKEKSLSEKKWKEIHGEYPSPSREWEIFDWAFNLGFDEADKMS